MVAQAVLGLSFREKFSFCNQISSCKFRRWTSLCFLPYYNTFICAIVIYSRCKWHIFRIFFNDLCLVCEVSLALFMYDITLKSKGLLSKWGKLRTDSRFSDYFPFFSLFFLQNFRLKLNRWPSKQYCKGFGDFLQG